MGEVAYDIELDVDDTFNTSLRAEGMSESHLRDLEELDTRVRPRACHVASRRRGVVLTAGDLRRMGVGPASQIADSLATIHMARRKRDFLAAFAANPVYFVNAWLDAQARDLKVRPPGRARQTGLVRPGCPSLTLS